MGSERGKIFDVAREDGSAKLFGEEGGEVRIAGRVNKGDISIGATTVREFEFEVGTVVIHEGKMVVGRLNRDQKISSASNGG